MPERISLTNTVLHRRSCETEPGWERRDPQRSGLWSCRLDPITPLCIHSHFEQQHRHQLGVSEQTAVIPGSSLRGMVRNVAEMLGAGCQRLYDPPDTPLLKGCTKDAACVVCRVFGFVHGSPQYCWRSKVQFSDAVAKNVTWKGYDLDAGRHGGGRGSSAVRGWAIFPHTPPDPLRPGSYWCVMPGRPFRFRVEYINLDAEEYAVLKYALTLEWQAEKLHHKLGFAKSLGLGGCRVTIPDDKSPPIPEPELRHFCGQPAFQELRRFRR